jgi:hypothetical protein
MSDGNFTVFVYPFFKLKGISLYLSFSTFGFGLIFDDLKIRIMFLVWLINIDFREKEKQNERNS